MPTTFIVGKKGGGKTLLAMREMEREFRNTKRTIVTNLPVVYERFREYLVEKYGTDFDYKKRLVMITSEQTAHFWLYYGLDRIEYVPFDCLPVDEQEREKKRVARAQAKGEAAEVEGKWVTHPLKITKRKFLFEANDEKKTKADIPDFAERRGHPPVRYFIDEVHIQFNSRRWTRTGDDCLYYISLERHFGDDQTLCTQCFGNVDKQMREMGQEYIVCTNQKKMPLPGTFGLVRRPGAFTAAHYADPPTKGAQDAMTVYHFGLDTKGIASCYRTVAGAEFGVGNDEADKGIAQKGKIPFSLLIVSGLILAVLAYYGVSYASNRLILGVAGKKGEVARKALESEHSAPGEGEVKQVSRHISPGQTADVKGEKEKPPEIYVTGFAWWQGKLQVMMSDGRMFTQGQHDFPPVLRDGIGRMSGVLLNGVQVRMKPQEHYGISKEKAYY